MALARVGEGGSALVKGLNQAGAAMFGEVSLIMRLAPIGASGAMAFAIGRYGIGQPGNLVFLMLVFYATCVLFVFVVLGAVMAYCRLSL